MVYLRRLLVTFLILMVVGLPLLHRVAQDVRYRNVRLVEPGRLFRSGQMDRTGFERFIRENGIRTVISLRETKDGEQYEDAFEEEVCAQSLVPVAFYRFSYLDWGAPDGGMPARANIDKFLGLMDDPKVAKPVLVHCFAGIHRTGGHVASYRVERQGWSPIEAWEELKATGSRRSRYKPDLEQFVLSLKPGTVGGPLEKQ